MNAAILAAASVVYRVSVVEAGRVVRVLRRKRNLILDQGLDGIAARSWVDSFAYAAVGTGTTPTKRDSGAVTVSRAGTTLTASAGFFEAADVGRLWKADSGEEVRISVYTDPTHVETTTSGVIAANEGTMWYVNQTALVTELKRTGTYSTDGGECGSTFAAGAWTHKRTFLFAAEVGVVTYREIGWSHSAAAGANLFGRDVLAGVGVTLIAGQQLKVSVELSVAFSPAASTAWANVIAGWAIDGDHGVEFADVRTVAANGTASGQSNLEPSAGAVFVALSTATRAIDPISSAGWVADAGGAVIALTGLAAGSYAAGSFTLDRVASWGVASGNSAAIRSIYINGHAGKPAYRVLLDTPATKVNTHRLDLTFTYAWGRVLTN